MIQQVSIVCITLRRGNDVQHCWGTRMHGTTSLPLHPPSTLPPFPSPLPCSIIKTYLSDGAVLAKDVVELVAREFEGQVAHVQDAGHVGRQAVPLPEVGGVGHG